MGNINNYKKMAQPLFCDWIEDHRSPWLLGLRTMKKRTKVRGAFVGYLHWGHGQEVMAFLIYYNQYLL